MKDTEGEVMLDIIKRQATGLNKYGISVSENPLSQREWLQHAYEECLDMAVYLKRTLIGMEEQVDEVFATTRSQESEESENSPARTGFR